MALQLPPFHHSAQSKNLHQLVKEFNLLQDTDHVQRLFYLQKINYLLNNISLTHPLYTWLNQSGPESWLDHLSAYNINPDASFFLKGIQFAQAVALHAKDIAVGDNSKNEYQLMQERDNFLKLQSFNECGIRYPELCHQLANLVQTDKRIKEIVENQTAILAFAKPKLDSIKGKKAESSDLPTPSYKTVELGDQVNNFNFKFKMGGFKDPFVFRVEDRAELGIEQDLHSFPVSKYFIEDFAVFIGAFKGEIFSIDHKPIVLSQFANQGNLADVAKRLKGQRLNAIVPIANHYFSQLGDFCTKLMETNTYHPDIKLSNFLVHNNLIRISDRKTLIKNANPLVGGLRSSPVYAPEEFNNCIDDEGEDYAPSAWSTHVNMPQFMAYQLGMALKEFLILTQLDEIPSIDDFRNPDFNAAYYFQSPPKQIINLSLLIQELTRAEPSKRLSISQFQRLLNYRNLSTELFYAEIEKILPSSTLGIQEDIDKIAELLNANLSGEELIKQANLIFNKLSACNPRETRLTRMAEKLAIKCYKEYSEPFFKDSIDTARLNNDWNLAPWYRKAIHWLSSGYFRIARVTELADIKESIINDLKSEKFQSYFPHLEFLPPSQLTSVEAQYFKEILYNYLDEILSQESESEEQSTSEESVKEDTKPQDPTPQTPVEETTPLNPGTKPLDSKEESEEESSAGYGTIVIVNNPNDDKNQPSLLHRFFNTPSKKEGADTTAPKPKPTLLTRGLDSIRTSLFRGDGNSHHIKRPNKRANINDINFEPLSDEEIMGMKDTQTPTPR